MKLSLVTEQGTPMDGMAFTDGDAFVEGMGDSRVMDVVYYPTINEYNGNRSIQVVIKEWKFHG